MTMGKLWSLLLLLLLSACATVPAPTAKADAPSAQFRRGVNIIGYDPIWQDASRARFQRRHFAEIRRGGFDFVRVNLFAFKHMDAANQIDPKWLERLDWVVREAGEAGLGVILDEHDFTTCAEDIPACRVKLPAFWRQIAQRYRGAPRSVAFELLNEPHQALDPLWNSFFPDLLAAVRESNPTRTVIIGPVRWNNFNELQNLRLPANDRNILVTFHYYEPFRFTHQGASWAGDVKNVSGVTWGSEADRAQIRADFAKVAQWARENDRPILLGEFGAYDKSGTPAAMRAAYTAAVAREAERNGFGWAYWQFDSDFIVWDMAANGWVRPIKSALIPAE